MLNAVIDFYNTATQRIKANQLACLNLIPNIDFNWQFHKNISLNAVKQKCRLVIIYWQQQKTVDLLTVVAQLEQLTDNYPQYTWVVIEFLSNFIREQTALSNSSAKINAELQAILTLIGKIHRKQELENEQLDLSHTDLRGVNLQKANLESANLYHLNLAGANLSQANLSGAILSAANLAGANLAGANLAGAILSAANFSQANLTGANLSQANLYLANLQQAILDHAILDGTNLRETKFSEIGT